MNAKATKSLMALAGTERLPKRLVASTDVTEAGCWITSVGSLNEAGYGFYVVRDLITKEWVQVSRHRLSFRVFRGALEGGKHIDHICFNAECFNPSHLDQVSPEENQRRAIRRRGWACPHGSNNSVSLCRECQGDATSKALHRRACKDIEWAIENIDLLLTEVEPDYNFDQKIWDWDIFHTLLVRLFWQKERYVRQEPIKTIGPRESTIESLRKESR